MILNALDEILFWNDISTLIKITKELTSKYYPHDHETYYDEKRKWLQSMIPDKKAFADRVDFYVKNGSSQWVGSTNQRTDALDESRLKRAIAIANTSEIGRKRAVAVESWDSLRSGFYQKYLDHIFDSPAVSILELTIGAGGGTSMIMKRMRENDCYVEVDIDFVCAKNADSIAKYFGVKGVGVSSSLWDLPFEDELFSVVTTHSGLEECREIPQIIAEAARVLKPSGKLVLRCLPKRNAQCYDYFDLYGFSDDEAISMLKKVRMLANADQLIDIAEKNGLHYLDMLDDVDLGYVVAFRKE